MHIFVLFLLVNSCYGYNNPGIYMDKRVASSRAARASKLNFCEISVESDTPPFSWRVKQFKDDLHDLLWLQLKFLAKMIRADRCRIYAKERNEIESSSMVAICEYNEINESVSIEPNLSLPSVVTEKPQIHITSDMAISSLPFFDGVLLAQFGDGGDTAQASDSIEEAMTLSATSISMILRAETARVEKLLWQEEMEDYVDYLEKQRLAENGATRNAVQAIFTLLGLLKPRLPYNDEITAELVDNIAVQLDSIAAIKDALPLQDADSFSDASASPLSTPWPLTASTGSPPLSAADHNQSDPTDIWRTVKEEKLLDLDTQKHLATPPQS